MFDGVVLQSTQHICFQSSVRGPAAQAVRVPHVLLWDVGEEEERSCLMLHFSRCHCKPEQEFCLSNESSFLAFINTKMKGQIWNKSLPIQQK